jgi:uncharacterized protein
MEINMKTHTFHVSGTHCASCKLLIEDILSDNELTPQARVDLVSQTLDVQTESPLEAKEIARILTGVLKPHGYSLMLEKAEEKKRDPNIIWSAIPIGVLFLALFFLLQKSGILNFGIGGQITPVTSFIVGLIASISSCLAIVGGLVLSLSAKISQDGTSAPGSRHTSETRIFALFHSGRLISFALLGGVLGLVGNAVGISFTFTAILGILASAVMLLLGLSLVGAFSRNRLVFNSRIFNFFRKIEHKTLAPLIVGFGTFFLPCGFTQTMQIAALSSGSFLSGSLIMLGFALGTLPMLALLSFGSASFAHSKHAPLFFKSAGVVVIGLGIFALLAGLAGLGIINPIFNI